LKLKIHNQRSGPRSARSRIFVSIKLLIILAPLPFGCVGGVWRPLFFALVALIGFFAWREAEKKERTPRLSDAKSDPARDLLYGRHLPAKSRQRGAMAWAARLWAGFAVFCLFQLLPLPAALVKVISPHTVDVMSRMRATAPGWLTISLVPRETLVFLLEFLVLAGFGLALARMRPGWRETTALIRVLAWSAAFQTLFGLVRLISGSQNFFFFFAPWEKQVGDLTGTLVNSNHFSFFLELAAPLILAILMNQIASGRGRLFHRVLDALEHRPGFTGMLAALVFTVAGVVLSNSRAGLTALMVGLVVAALMMVRTRGTGLRRLWPILAVTLVILVMVVAGGSTWKHFRDLPLDPDHGTGRVQRWPSVFEMAGDFPILGTGMGTFRWAYFLYDQEANQWVTHAHNDVLETVTDGGALGGLLFLGGFMMFAVALFAAWRRRNRVSVRLLVAGGIASLTAAFFHSLFDFSLRIPVNALALVLVMALTWRMAQYRRTPARPRPLRDGGTW